MDTTSAAIFTLGDSVLEVRFPRADILRLRAGQAVLPRDESWAVPASRRQAAVPFTRFDQGATTTIVTGAMRVVIDHATLALRIEDSAGRLVTEAPAGFLRFAAAGFEIHYLMLADAQYFGLGDKTGPLNRRNNAFVLWNSDAPFFSDATDPLYKSIPFVLQVQPDGAALGIFLDNTWRTGFDFGRAQRDTLRITAEDGPLDLYILAGPDAKSVLRQYDFLTGPAPLPPLWALGFQQSRWSYMTQDEAQSIAGQLREHHIPADALYLDIDYQDRNRPFTVSADRFPDLPGLIARLRAQGMRLVLITDLHIAFAPDENYAPYDTGAANDLFVKDPDGSDFVGEVWPGPSVFPDFSMARARAWWGGLYKDFLAIGAAGFWNDMNEPSVFHLPGKTMPPDTVHRIEEPGFATRTASHAEMHNLVGMLNSRATYEGLLHLAPDERPFVLTRATAAGGQRYAATWTGDNVSTWAHLDLSIRQIASLGLSGFAYSGADVGGFGGPRPAADLLTRWIAIGAFTPLFRDHAMIGKPAQEPWVDGETHTAIRRRFIEERYRLLPYLYTLAEENHRTGLPILRPVWLEFPHILGRHHERQETSGAFMLGADLLVAPSPVLESAEPYTILLPGPGWFDYWTGERLAGSAITVAPRIDHLPIFVRPGAILPRQNLVQSTSETPSGNLLLDIYPGADMAGTLYTDDGVSLDYQHGAYYRRGITCTAQDADHVIELSSQEGHHKPWWKSITLTVHGSGALEIAEQAEAIEVRVCG